MIYRWVARYMIYWMALAKRLVLKLLYTIYVDTRLGLWHHKRNVRKSYLKYDLANGHCRAPPICSGKFKIYPVPVLDDNYSYIVVHRETEDVVVIDPSDPARLLPILEANRWVPSAVLTTHKHWDHAGGNGEMARLYRGIAIFGSSIDRPYGTTNYISDGAHINVGHLHFTAHLTPGHTRGHLVYHLDGSAADSPSCLFTGDLLFLGGCGKFFEGSPGDMFKSLETVRSFPKDTLILSGHEYAKDNLVFALSVEKDNDSVQDKLAWVYDQRHNSKSTLPSSLAEELSYNPFLRLDCPAFRYLATSRRYLDPLTDAMDDSGKDFPPTDTSVLLKKPQCAKDSCDVRDKEKREKVHLVDNIPLIDECSVEENASEDFVSVDEDLNSVGKLVGAGGERGKVEGGCERGNVEGSGKLDYTEEFDRKSAILILKRLRKLKDCFKQQE